MLTCWYSLVWGHTPLWAVITYCDLVAGLCYPCNLSICWFEFITKHETYIRMYRLWTSMWETYQLLSICWWSIDEVVSHRSNENDKSISSYSTRPTKNLHSHHHHLSPSHCRCYYIRKSWKYFFNFFNLPQVKKVCFWLLDTRKVCYLYNTFFYLYNTFFSF